MPGEDGGGRREKTRSGEIVNELLLKGKYGGEMIKSECGSLPSSFTLTSQQEQLSIWVISNGEKKDSFVFPQNYILNYQVFAF